MAHLEQQLASTPLELKSPDHVYDYVTDTWREVDVAVRARVGTEERLIIFECRDRSRVEDVTWIEQLATKQRSVRANAVVAVSSAGFSAAARRLADHESITLREISRLAAGELFEWLGARELCLRLRRLEMHRVSLDLDPESEESVQLSQDAVAALNSASMESLILRRKQSGEFASLGDLWRTIRELPFERSLGPGERQNVRLNLNYSNPDDRFQIETDTEPIDIVKATIYGTFWYTDELVPTQQAFRYREAGEVIAENARISLPLESGTVELSLGRSFQPGYLWVFTDSRDERTGRPLSIATEVIELNG